MMKFIFVLLFPILASAVTYQEGDLVFHKSSSNQGPALMALTNSPWTHVGVIVQNQDQFWVAEASSQVKFTRLKDFIARGKNGHYIIKRLNPEIGVIGEAERTKLRASLTKYIGKDYDIWFQWSDSTIYCSELVWKIYSEAMGIELSVPQRFRDFPIDSPVAREMIRSRYVNQGREFNVDELVVSPVAVLESPLLIEVDRNTL